MCGRFTLTTSAAELAEVFELSGGSGTAVPPAGAERPRFNIAPTQDVAAVRITEGTRKLGQLHWGLIPRWSRDPSQSARMINARSETVREKPAFRDAFKQRRCIVPANGFYEWGRRGMQRGPHFFSPQQGGVIGFAGLWESWRGEDREIESCTILTTQANAVVAPVHERMPVILPPEAFAEWLDTASDPAGLARWLCPAPEATLSVRRVSTLVNDVKRDAPELIEPEVSATLADGTPDWGPLFRDS